MASPDVATTSNATGKQFEQLDDVVIRFAGDSGDGMQLAGTQFTNVSASFGNDVSTLPDFPAEIRAPAGSLSGVSGFQLQFSSHDIYTPGDNVDTLVAMNPAALKTSLADLKRGGTLIVNEDAYDKGNLTKAGYDRNPLDSADELAGYSLHRVPMTRLTRDAVDGLGLSLKEADRCKNFFALGLVYWLYERDRTPTEDWVKSKFAKNPDIVEANLRALKAGSDFGYSTESFTVHYRVSPAKLKPGKYRKMTGNEALAFGLATAAKLAGEELIFSGYPITPASDILHELSKLKNFGVKTFQAEDEIAAMAAAVGAAFGGSLSVTASSGPGICLKGEAMGLGVITELPIVIVNVQRGGPSTGLPTKTEQSDLLLSMFGRNGESPLPIVAAATPADCFDAAQEAMRLAVEFMTPVVLLSDGYIANGAEPWRIPEISDLTPIRVEHPTELNGDDDFLPYKRDERLVRPWVRTGTPGFEHRLGGLEKADVTGHVEYSPTNHQHMTDVREAKVAGIADHIPEQEVDGPDSGKLLVVSWGGTYGSVRTAVRQFISRGETVAHAHLRYLNPFPRNLGDLLSSYDKVLVPELNNGQLRFLLRNEFLVDAQGFNKVQGKPFLVGELVEHIETLL
ncbi:MAG: 2-oxoacid:acceptor oxidoreductase subunit alpha [Planctomycetaceae bacterium]|jgi:2-oxoglutarate/2-oxoacid ferredoxin oxidoreductase subunit alpha|nr:2-oxoacid:acceptor oxidoreductase subunit alpha [Planctomycetaceae bacterium]MBT6484041.1 2-oxoacid:acceptor oxidoreductase subunit alpha [Planctomycetaceae bacterium]MBT6496840.1 2-oxoacid:acceptor oxidoreductase subunit alpha [Planctomycetaceae bacterium]